jgi:epoxyqueuosine reductase
MRTEELIKQRALELGFDLAGVAPVDPGSNLEFARRWTEQGRGGEMRYLENARRHDARRVLPSVRSVVCVGLIYNAPLPYSTEAGKQESGVRSQQSAVGRQEEEVRSQKSEAGSREWGAEGRESGDARGWISRYAWGRDYHELMRAKLEALRTELEKLAPGVETRVYVDTGPVVERAFARYSGIGWTGKNTCLINERKGSWFFLGVVLSNLALEPDLPAPDRCGSCTRCLEACPTGALVEPYVMDASRCIAYLNIELKGSIPERFRAALGANVFGCDICQDVCPWNGRSQEPEVRSQNDTGQTRAATTNLPEFQPLTLSVRKLEDRNSKINNSSRHQAAPSPGVNRQSSTTNRKSFPDSRLPTPDSLLSAPDCRSFSLFNPPLEALASLSEEDFRQTFRHSPIRRVNYRGWLRNLSVAMGNSGDARLIPKLRELARHSDPLVREHAAWALQRLEERAGLAAGTEGR